MKTIINIKTEKAVKDDAMRIADEIGLSLSAVINVFLKRFIVERHIDITSPLEPSRSHKRLIKQLEKDLKSGKNLSPLFVNIEKMDRYLASL